MNFQVFQNPLLERYSSNQMLFLFSPQFKFSTWRKLWVYLAEAEKKAGLNITKAQIKEMKKHVNNIDFNYVSQKEKELRHDVMAHIHAFAQVAPSAARIIHLGATSAYVGDNTDLIQYRAGLEMLNQKILNIMVALKSFCLKYKNLPTLAYTHFQVAQPTTVGKRASLWLQDLFFDFEQIKNKIQNLPFRGLKGTTGSQASLMKLLNNNQKKIKEVEKYICQKAGFKKLLWLTGQTYTRKIDYHLTTLLSNVAQSAAKFANDLRLLSHLKEVEEPFEKNQIGSSAMPYKRNPIRSERINSLARFVVTLANSTAHTASTQWLERTLDDSANKRLALPECFLAVDAILNLYQNIVVNLQVNQEVVENNFNRELPFIITENLLMEQVKKGGNRQTLHAAIRRNALKALNAIKKGKQNPLLKLIAQDKQIKMTLNQLKKLNNPMLYIGRCPEMVEEFIKNQINPILKFHQKIKETDLKV